jgi:hypothetical protein
MPLNSFIEDGTGSGRKARISEYGQLAVSPLDYSSVSSNKLEVANTAYNFIAPKSGHKVVITDILLYANKNVGAGDATVVIYTSDVGPTATTVKETILETEMLKQTARDITGVNLIVENEGRWVNAKTDDDDIFCQIGYYYVPLVKD